MLRIILVIIGIAASAVGLLGFRGQLTKNRPWHVFWDMKYQPKYTSQAQSNFFADGRTARMPVTGTIAYTTPGYFTDAGLLNEPNPDPLKEDDVYYRGIAGADVEIEVDAPVMGADGKPVLDENKKPKMEKKKELVPNWVRHLPKKALENAVAVGELSVVAESQKEAYQWRKLLERGKERFNINCAACHGTTGYGGQGETAHGIVGRYGMIGIANYHQDRLREMADGEIYNTITNGKNSMSSYGHQVKVQDRWAIVAYIRVLQMSQKAPENLIPAQERERILGGKP